MDGAVENEYKFVSYEGDYDAINSELREHLRRSGMAFREKSKHSIDNYYDSNDLALYHSDCCLRKKTTKKGKSKLTIKKPIDNGHGMMSRQEIEESSDGSLDSIKGFAERYLPGIVIKDEPVISVETDRTVFEYLDGSGVKLSLDHCFYKHGEMSKEFYEIEIESMSDITVRDFDSIGIIDTIVNDLRFRQTTVSKYSRGMDWILGKRSFPTHP